MTETYFALSDSEDLKRFILGDLLGEGADMQAFEATDADTGDQVVVKRPHPSLVSRYMHRTVEARTLLQAEMRTRVGDANGLVRLRLVAEADSFSWYFGDDLGHPYIALVEERAEGVPLMGGISDMVRGHPVSLPLNLFALFPPANCGFRQLENPARAVLDIIERFYELGFLAEDLGPQNVFYSPYSRASKVIDLGALRKPSEGTSRHPPFDLNDALFDVFRFYTTPDTPPRDPADFERTREIRVSGSLERKAETLSKEYAMSDSAGTETALKILSRVARREFKTTAQFRLDFTEYLAALDSRPSDAVAEKAWLEAARRLKSPYWGKYLFDPDIEW